MLCCFWVNFLWAVVCNAAPVSESKIKCFLVKYPAIEYTILIIWKVLMVLFNNRFFFFWILDPRFLTLVYSQRGILNIACTVIVSHP